MLRHVFFDLDNTLVHRVASVERYVDSLLLNFDEIDERLGRDKTRRIVSECDNGGYLPADAAHSTIRERIKAAVER